MAKAIPDTSRLKGPINVGIHGSRFPSKNFVLGPK
jgi:hypothetical protein